ncbi:hypothetical protein [Delftia acidovorans]|uniref:hypothetical protein n=1 Tax=Delftia acidovorans TaxID=80866 RepID=UPI003341EFA9
MTDPKKLQEDRESESNIPKNHLGQSPTTPADLSLQAAGLSGSIAGRDHKALDRMRAALNASISALSPEEILGNETTQSPQSLPEPDLRLTTSNSKGSSQSPSPPKDINLFQQQASGRFEYGSFLHSYPHGVETPTQISNHSYIASKNSKPASHANNKTRETHVSPRIPLIEFNGKISKSKPTTSNPKINIKNSETPISKNTKDNETKTQKTPDSPAKKSTPIQPILLKVRPSGGDPPPRQQITGSTPFSHMLEGRRREQEEREDKRAEYARRSAIASEAALRAERNRALEAQKEAAFYRNEAARAKDEAMLARKGMWLGLMVALACVCTAILAYLITAPHTC